MSVEFEEPYSDTVNSIIGVTRFNRLMLLLGPRIHEPACETFFRSCARAMGEYRVG